MFNLSQKLLKLFERKSEKFVPAMAGAENFAFSGSCGTTCLTSCDGSCRGTCSRSCQGNQR